MEQIFKIKYLPNKFLKCVLLLLYIYTRYILQYRKQLIVTLQL